jgi:hypothetical protein
LTGKTWFQPMQRIFHENNESDSLVLYNKKLDLW